MLVLGCWCLAFRLSRLRIEQIASSAGGKVYIALLQKRVVTSRKSYNRIMGIVGTYSAQFFASFHLNFVSCH
jgi:hypothetical protein